MSLNEVKKKKKKTDEVQSYEASLCGRGMIFIWRECAGVR